MSQLEFDENVAKHLERMYASRDVLRRRALVRAALGATAGDAVLDVGCGPGFYAAEVLDEVGPDGRVVGIDASPQMLAIAADRCAGRDNAEFHSGDATAIPVDDATFDRALSVQVLEYVDDATGALAEIHRTLKPGGRAVVWDVDWATVSWRSDHPERMARILTAWDAHLVHRSLPQTLGARLRDAGFENVDFEGHVFATRELTPEAYGGALMGIIESFVAAHPDISDDELAAWVDEQRRLDENGEFFFSCVQFCFTATKPLT